MKKIEDFSLYSEADGASAGAADIGKMIDTINATTSSIVKVADIPSVSVGASASAKAVETIAATITATAATSVGKVAEAPVISTATGTAVDAPMVSIASGTTAIDTSAATSKGIVPITVPTTPPVTSTGTSTNTMQVGMNLSSVDYYGTQYPFLDRFKTSSEWMVQGTNGQPAGPLTLDANGYPTAMPTGASNVFTMVGLDPVALDMPDVYVMTYEGNATIGLLDATILSSEPGKITFRYTGTGSATAVNLSWIDPANPISDMHIVRQDQVALYESGEIFNPAFLDKASQWSELRFMDWGNTNNNTLTSWDQRTTVNSASWSHISSTASVPIEIMVALANKTKTDMWINIPAEANDDYVRKTLAYVRDNLAAGLSVKVEYSNEVWNWGFQQASYAQSMGAQLFGTDLNGNGQIDRGTNEEPSTAYLQYYGYRAAQVASIANSVFGANAGNRLQNVLSTQTVYFGIENYIFDGIQAAGLGTASSLFDNYAITTYFDLSSVDQATLVSWAHSGQTGIDAAFSGLNASLTDNLRLYVYQQAVAARNGLSLVAYEGGLSLTAYTFPDSEQAAMLAFFDALDDDPRMGELYTKMVADFAASGGSGLNAFHDTGTASKWGTWGTLDSIYDTGSPRYDALVAASQAAKAAALAGSDLNQVNVRTSAASYVLGANQLTLTYVGTGGFNGTGNDQSNTITGGNSFNMLYGGGGDDTIIGGSRNDVIDGGNGADRMFGGAGDDIYTVDNVGDMVVEQADGGTDEVRTTVSSYTLTANVENLTFTGTGPITGIGNDLDNVITAAGVPASLYGGAGNDTLNGSVGADYLDGGTGADIMRGGRGNDTYIVDNAGDRVIELAGGGIDTVRTTLNQYGLAAEVENLTFVGTGNLDAFGNSADNVMIGGTGNDTLWGDTGNDTLNGGAGNDALIGGVGVDTMIGGLGDDRYDVDNAGDIVVEAAGQGIDSVYSSIDYKLAANVENMVLTGANNINGTGNELANTIFGNDGDNILSGGLGDDTLIGGGGNDTLVGGDGNDALSGGDGDDILNGRMGDDTIDGGAGNDVIWGGMGRDTMDGGTGADRYIFYAGDTGQTRATADFITFSHDEGDLIDLSRMDAKIASPVDDAFNFIGQSAFTKTAGELRIQYSGGYWDVLGDTNGDGIADFSITVSAGTTPLIARDFVL